MFNKLNTQKSDPDRIQTYNLLIRSQMLYSVELPSHQADLPTSLVTAKVQYLDKFSKDSRQIGLANKFVPLSLYAR